MNTNKEDEELLARYAAAIRAGVIHRMNIHAEPQTLDPEKIGQEILGIMQEGRDAKAKLREIAEQVRELKPGQEPV